MPPPPDAEAGRSPGPDPNAPAGRLSGWSAGIVAAYGLAVLLVQFGTPWALTFHEVNFAEPAREFLRTGDWLVPRIGGRPLWDKPPLMHWSIAAALSAFGTEAEWAARLPATLSAVVVALAVASMAARWHGDRAGLLAGLVQSTSLHVLMQARLAEADMPLCAAVAVAMASLARGGRRPAARRADADRLAAAVLRRLGARVPGQGADRPGPDRRRRRPPSRSSSADGPPGGCCSTRSAGP